MSLSTLRVIAAAVLALLCLSVPVWPDTPAGGTQSAQYRKIAHKSRRKRGRIPKPAEFMGAGLLQFEYGYDGDFRAPDADAAQVGTASLLYNATEDLQLEADFDTFHALTTDPDRSTVGVGDAYASAQITASSETRERPSLGFAYLVKIPTASSSSGLGTGRPDHKLGLLVSKKFNTTEVDFNASLLVNDNPGTRRWETGCQLALGLSRELTSTLSLQGEVFGETLDADQPRGAFVQGGLTYQPTTRASFDLGIRAGIDREAPRFGATAGVSLSLTNLYGSKAER